MEKQISENVCDALTVKFKELAGLYYLALDQRGSSSAAADELWSRVDPILWSKMRNPWLILQRISAEKLTQLTSDKDFLFIFDVHLARQQERLESPGWFKNSYPQSPLKRIAYFCMEFGLSEALPIYSGGLGMLAGDHLKTASDIDIPLTGVGLLYQRGYFRQFINGNGQSEVYPYNDPNQLPIVRTRRSNGETLSITVELLGHQVSLRVWEVVVGKIKLYLLDSNDAVNNPIDRGITNELYGGNSEHRLRQEIVLGLGGWKLLQSLGIAPEICHLNEGHAAFVILARAQSVMHEYGVSFKEALTITRVGNLFTTHTPVLAGFDRFPPALIAKYFGDYIKALGISLDELLSLGRQDPDNPDELFNMAYLSVRGSGAVNGVSRLHGEVSRRLFAPLFPRWPVEEIPVGHVTNGVHIPSWESAKADHLWAKGCGKERWSGTLETMVEDFRQISDEELWAFRFEARKKLISYVKDYLTDQKKMQGADSTEILQTTSIFDPNALIMGFARRFAEYKRVNLLLYDQERLLRLISDAKHPVQIIMAGKAHPQDEIGKAIIRQWLQFIEHPEVRGRIVFLADYDILMAERLVQGVDLWINTPRRPWEASGTSGMKLLANGGLNFSELDGWWAEAYSPDVGWAIGNPKECSPDPSRDHEEAEALYNILEQEIIPTFYNRNAGGIPTQWLKFVRESMSTLTPRFSTNRMVREYTESYYIPGAKAYLQRANQKGAQGIQLEKWCQRLALNWNLVQFLDMQIQDSSGQYIFRVKVKLGDLRPEEVRVQLYANSKESEKPFCQEMHLQEKITYAGPIYTYMIEISKDRPVIAYTARIVPQHKEGALIPLETKEILWQH